METMNDLATCPRCGHQRAADEHAPDWQCPACGVAYAKAAARAASGLVTPRPADTPVYRAAARDNSLWSLLAVNAGALLLAWWNGWTLTELMLVYWGQSVIIGAASVLRILRLREFSTENFKINNQSVEPTRATQVKVAGFFVLHFGLFHVVYLVFLTEAAWSSGILLLPVLICVAAFAVNHLYSLRYNIEVDRQGRPNIGTLMFTPYLRVVPMHLMLLFGLHLAPSGLGMLVFGLLKTAADAGMHLVEHARFAARKS